MIGTLDPDRSDHHGERNDVARSRIPIAWMRRVNTPPKALSLSRTIYVGALSQGNASVIWHAQQLPPYAAENKKCEELLKGNRRNHKEINRAIPSARLRRKVFHVCDGRPRLGTMYFETRLGDFEAFRSSPWMCGAPQSGFLKLILRIRSLGLDYLPCRGSDR
jgi:hypothetical protein